MTPQSSLVLLVDMGASLGATVGRALQDAGHRVEVVSGPGIVADYRERFTGPLCILIGTPQVDPAALQQIDRLHWAALGAPTIVIAARADIEAAVRAMKGGAFDVIAEPVDRERLVAMVVRALVANTHCLADELRLGELRRNYDRLTAREREVLYAITDGMLNKQAAYQLGIAEKTIKVHRAKVMQKMGAESVAALVRMVDAYRQYRERRHPLLGDDGAVPKLEWQGAPRSPAWTYQPD